jgi:pyruvate dehydrogenase E2 component (dihydrolipoamide acetyltransferase)
MASPDDLRASVRKAIASAMQRSNREIPHYYVIRTIDVHAMMSWLRRTNAERPIQHRLLSAAVMLKAIAVAVRRVPELNATWDGALRPISAINIGVVISLRGGGLSVPAIVGTDTLTIDEIMVALNDIIPRARAMRLRSSEFGTATIAVTSLGESGADEVLGLIYPPHVAIIGIGGIIERPVAAGGTVVVHPTVRVSVGGDHRATDGLVADRFLCILDELLQHPEAL